MSLQHNVTFDDFSPFFVYSSSWTTPDTSANGYPNGDSFLSSLVDGTEHSTNTAGSTVSFSFTGSTAFIYGISGPALGSYSVAVNGDGGYNYSGSAYSASNTTNHLLWSTSNLTANAEHTVTLMSETAGLLIDYALVPTSFGASGATLTNTTVDNTDSRLTYTGTWSSNNDTRFVDGSSSYTIGDQNSVSLNFSGSAVYVYGDTVDDHGPYTVVLDGKSTSLDGLTAALKIGTLMYFAGGLSSSPHTLSIINNGTTFFDLDEIIYTTPSAYVTANATSTSPTSSGAGGSSTAPASSSAPSSTTPKSGSTRLMMKPKLSMRVALLIGLVAGMVMLA